MTYLKLIIGILLGAGISCSPLAKPNPAEPKNCVFNVTQIKVESTSLRQTTIFFATDIRNPSKDPAVLYKVEASFRVNNDFLGNGVNQDEITIKGEEIKTIYLHTTIEHTGSYQAIKSILRDQRPIDYRLAGTAYFKTRTGDYSVPFAEFTQTER